MFQTIKRIFVPFFILCFFVAGIFLPLQFVFAKEAGCACYSKDKNCEVYGSLTVDKATKSGCLLACFAKSKEENLTGEKIYINAEYIGSDANVAKACTIAAKKFIEDNKATAVGQAATATPDNLKESITPTLNVDIPGLNFNKPIIDGGDITSSFIADYLTAVYRYLIGISITIAIVMVMIGGLQYVLAAGSGNVKKGKQRIVNAVTGLTLLMSVYIILYTVNPELTMLKAIRMQNVAEFEVSDEEGFAAEAEGIGALPTPGTPIKRTMKQAARDDCMLKQYAPGRAVGDSPEVRTVNFFGLTRIKTTKATRKSPAITTRVLIQSGVNKYSAPQWEKVSAAILASKDPEIKAILLYMQDFKDKRVPDLTGVMDGSGTVSVNIAKGIGRHRKTGEFIGVSSGLHAFGLAVDFMTRSAWAIKWKPGKTSGTSFCHAYKKTLQEMKTGKFKDLKASNGKTLSQDPYLLFKRLAPQVESCINKFQNGQWTFWPKAWLTIFEQNGFRLGAFGWGNKLYADAMHFETIGKCN